MDTAGIASTNMAAAMRRDGKLTAMVPAVRTKATIPTMCLVVRVLLVIVSNAVIHMVIARMLFFIAMAREMVFRKGCNNMNGAGFIVAVHE